MYRISKILSLIVIVIAALNLVVTPAYAAPLKCGDLTDAPPGPEEIVCPFVRVVNIFLYSAGAILIIMLLYGGIKLALAMGDPKGLQAASSTWTWAIIGFFVIVGSFTILYLISRWFGWNYTFTGVFSNLQNAILNFMHMLGITSS